MNTLQAIMYGIYSLALFGTAYHAIVHRRLKWLFIFAPLNAICIVFCAVYIRAALS